MIFFMLVWFYPGFKKDPKILKKLIKFGVMEMLITIATPLLK